jgi:hypothetical protein
MTDKKIDADEAIRSRLDEGDDGDDTEGHGLLIDAATASGIQRGRQQEIERQARERQQAKEARPNRSNSR